MRWMSLVCERVVHVCAMREPPWASSGFVSSDGGAAMYLCRPRYAPSGRL